MKLAGLPTSLYDVSHAWPSSSHVDPDGLRGRFTPSETHVLVCGANSVRSLIRMKVNKWHSIHRVLCSKLSMRF